MNHTDLKPGVKFIYQGQPYEILESNLLFKGRGSSVLQAKIKNLVTGQTVSKTFRPSDEFQEAEIEKVKTNFIYSHRGQYFFSKADSPKERFQLSKEAIGESRKFLKPGQELEALIFKGRVINIALPIKVQLRIKESPPGIKGDRAQGGTKTAVLETGASLNVPLFLKEGDLVEVNTVRGDYVRRIK